MKLLRRKEYDKFLEADVDDLALLELYKTGVGIEPHSDKPLDDQVILQRAGEYLAQNNLAQKNVDKTRHPSILGKANSFRLKQIVLSETHRKLLLIFDDLLGDRYTVFSHLPLDEFLEQQGDELKGSRISFIICDAAYLNVVAGVEIQSRDAINSAFLDQVFLQINVPLVRLSKVQASSLDHVKEKLSFLLKENLLREDAKCSRCHSPMQKRKVSRGSESQLQIQQKQVVYRWICTGYPVCKGNLKVRT